MMIFVIIIENPQHVVESVPYNMSLVVRKPVDGVSDQSDTNRAVKSQNMSRCLKFLIYEEEGLYYSCSGYLEADLRLFFYVCKKPVFSRRGAYGPLESYLWGSGHDLTQTGLYSKLARILLLRIYTYEEEKF